MRALTSADRSRVFATLERDCSSGSIVALRNRALITLAADTGLRVGECCALDTAQLLVSLTPTGPIGPAERAVPVRFASSFYLKPTQAKGGAAGAGTVEVSERARSAVGAYVKAAIAARWMCWPPAPTAPLFLAHRGHQGKVGHERLSIRSAQHSWHEIQKRAGLSSRYPFHALRHDAASRWRRAGADVYGLMRQMRWRDMDTAQRYVHDLDAGARAPKIARRVAEAR